MKMLTLITAFVVFGSSFAAFADVDRRWCLVLGSDVRVFVPDNAKVGDKLTAVFGGTDVFEPFTVTSTEKISDHEAVQAELHSGLFKTVDDELKGEERVGAGPTSPMTHYGLTIDELRSVSFIQRLNIVGFIDGDDQGDSFLNVDRFFDANGKLLTTASRNIILMNSHLPCVVDPAKPFTLPQ